MSQDAATPSPHVISEPPQSSNALFKRMLQGSGIYSLAFVGQQLVGIALVPVKTHFLMPQDYGILGLLEKAGILISALLGVGFPAALGYFYFQADTAARKRAAVLTSVIGAGLLGLAAFLICWPLAPLMSRLVFKSSALTYSMVLVLLGMPPVFLLEGLLGWLRVEDRPRLWLFGSTLRLAVTLIAVAALLAVFHLRILGVQYASLAASGIPAIVLAVYCIRQYGFGFDGRLFLRMARFAAPLALGGVAMFVMHYADLFILVRYVSMTDVGLYTFAYTIGMLISAVWGSFQVYWGAQVFHIMKRHDADEVFARSFTYLLLAVAFCGVGMIVSAKPALAILASPAYNGALRLIPLVVLAYCIRSCGEFFRSLFLVEGRPGYDAACTWIASAAGLAAYLILIPRFGVWGAAAGTIATFTMFSTVSVIWTYRLRPYRVETARLLKIGAAAAAPLALHMAVPVPAIGLQVIWAALLILSFPALLLVLGFATRDERLVTKSALRAIARLVSRESGEPVTP